MRQEHRYERINGFFLLTTDYFYPVYSCCCHLKWGQEHAALVSCGPTTTPKLNSYDQVAGSTRRGRGENNTCGKCETFRWRQMKTTDKSSNLDRVHLAGFKAMRLLEPRGFKRIKVAAAASESLPCFDIICLSRTPLALTRQRRARLSRGCTTQTSHNYCVLRLPVGRSHSFAPHAIKRARLRLADPQSLRNASVNRTNVFVCATFFLFFFFFF